MDLKQRAALVEKLLNEAFPSPQIPLKASSPFMLLVAVMLSAQCTDERVNTVTKLLFRLAKTPEEMAALSVEEIYEIIRPCGLGMRKAHAISSMSKKIVEEHQGCVPMTEKKLETLPGVGHKTASVVLVQAFHTPAFPVDTHIFRVAHRWGLSEGKTVVQVEKDLCRLFHKDQWGKIHLQMILYARAFCPARLHQKNCSICQAVGVSDTPKHSAHHRRNCSKKR
jgi:endonuclease-3